MTCLGRKKVSVLTFGAAAGGAAGRPKDIPKKRRRLPDASAFGGSGAAAAETWRSAYASSFADKRKRRVMRHDAKER